MKPTSTGMEKRVLIGFLIFVFLLGLLEPANADLNAGVKAYLDGNYSEALKYILPEAQDGNPVAQSILGSMYWEGDGVPKSYQQGAFWFQEAAKRGDAFGQYSIGYGYEFGLGVPKDYSKAFTWYSRSAEQGYSEGQFRLAGLYFNGKGVAENPYYAVKNFTAAAEQGHPRAQFLLGLAYHYGYGTSLDFVEAYKWYNLAASKGIKEAGDQRDKLALAMTSSQVYMAQKLSTDWKPVSGKSQIKESPLEIQPKTKTTEIKGTGSGFVVSDNGHIITNNHVTKGCSKITVQLASGVRTQADLLASDADLDISLLKIKEPVSAYASFRVNPLLRSGEPVVVVGYPLRGLLASEANVTTGTLSALAGPRDDPSLLQITAPVQPGNSGGPLLDKSGNIIGVVVGKLDAIKVASAIGDIPQNINYAIKGELVRQFLEKNGGVFTAADSTSSLEAADIGDQARQFTVVVECWESKDGIPAHMASTGKTTVPTRATESGLSKDDSESIKDGVRRYYQFVQRKDVDAAMDCYASERRPYIKRPRLLAVAKDTDYYRIEEIDVTALGPERANAVTLLKHKKYNQPIESWEINLEFVREAGQWKIWSTPGKRISP
jgi:hypothetical protein